MNRFALAAVNTVTAVLAVSPPALAASLERDPVALVERSLARSSVTFAGASATASAYTISWTTNANASPLALVFASEARTAREAGLVRSFILEAPLDASGRLPRASRDALLRVSDALNRTCFARSPHDLGVVIDAALSNRLHDLSLRPETRVSVEDGETGRVLRLGFTLPRNGVPGCAMPVPRR